MTFETELAPGSDPGYEARGWVRRQLGERVTAVQLYDLLTVVTELVSNAVVHGDGGETPIGLSVTVEPDGRISGSVENAGGGTPEIVDRANGRLDPGSALGLRIVDALTESWSAEVNGSTRVSFRLAQG